MIFKGISLIFLASLANSQIDLPEPAKPDIAKPTRSPIVAWHVPPGLKSYLHLSPSDLKIFSGHALHMLSSKCPAVKEEKIVQLRKYLSKLLADGVEQTGSIHSSNQRFHGLLQSLVTCAKTVEHPPSSKDEPPRGIQQLYPWMVYLDGIKPPDVDLEALKAQHSASATVSFLESLQRSLPNSESAQEGNETTTERVGRKFVLTSRKSTQRVSEWFLNAYEEVKNFFAHTLPGAISGKRKRRSADEELQVTIPTMNSLARKTPGQSLQMLADQICRIFCSKCGSHSLMRTLIMAERELLDYLMTDENHVRALESIMDQEFLTSIDQCESTSLSLMDLLGLSHRLRHQ